MWWINLGLWYCSTLILFSSSQLQIQLFSKDMIPHFQLIKLVIYTHAAYARYFAVTEHVKTFFFFQTSFNTFCAMFTSRGKRSLSSLADEAVDPNTHIHTHSHLTLLTTNTHTHTRSGMLWLGELLSAGNMSQVGWLHCFLRLLGHLSPLTLSPTPHPTLPL